MNEQLAREILADMLREQDHPDFLTCTNDEGEIVIAWAPGNNQISLDGTYSIEQIEAISWWMRNKGNRK